MIEALLLVVFGVSILILIGSFLLTLLWEVIVFFVERSWMELMIACAFFGVVFSLVGIAVVHFFGN